MIRQQLQCLLLANVQPVDTIRAVVQTRRILTQGDVSRQLVDLTSKREICSAAAGNGCMARWIGWVRRRPLRVGLRQKVTALLTRSNSSTSCSDDFSLMWLSFALLSIRFLSLR